jgi:hypothetical protein
MDDYTIPNTFLRDFASHMLLLYVGSFSALPFYAGRHLKITSDPRNIRGGLSIIFLWEIVRTGTA